MYELEVEKNVHPALHMKCSDGGTITRILRGRYGRDLGRCRSFGAPVSSR